MVARLIHRFLFFFFLCLYQDSMASLSTDMSSDDGMRHSIHDKIKIVSQQSTARPGCVIQLDAIADATHVSAVESL